MGIVTAFPIQTLALPIVLAGQDIIGQARTGTGKTLAFGIPILQQLSQFPASRPSAPSALVVVPTRELASQVADDLRTAGSGQGARVLTVYGGRAYEPQIEALRATVDVVVGTPGRLLDLVGQRHLVLSGVRMLVLDEADKMLDLGFLPDVERILQLTPPDRQTMLFSATMPGDVVTLARRHLRQPMHVRGEQHDETQYVALTRQHVFRAHQMDKIEMLARLLQASGRGLTMVFCRTKRTADQVAGALATRGFAAAAVHGDLGQGQRERALRAFRSRTGRAGRSGVAVTFVDWRDMQRWKLINETLGLGLEAEPPETYSTSEHFYSALDIPQGATGNLPRAQRGRQGLEAEELEDLGETGRIRSPAARRAGAGARDAAPRKPRVRKRTRGGLSARGEQAEPAAEHGGKERTQPAAGRRRRSRGGRKGPVPGQV